VKTRTLVVVSGKEGAKSIRSMGTRLMWWFIPIFEKNQDNLLFLSSCQYGQDSVEEGC
jgi:hypothetical protein